MVAGAGLLVLAGLAKLVSPVAGHGIPALLGLSDAAVRALGVVELVLGGTALLLRPSRAALLVTPIYALLGLFTTLALAAGMEHCGCFGRYAVDPALLAAVDFGVFAGGLADIYLAYAKGHTGSRRLRWVATGLAVAALILVAPTPGGEIVFVRPGMSREELLRFISSLCGAEVQRVVNRATFRLLVVRSGCHRCEEFLRRLEARSQGRSELRQQFLIVDIGLSCRTATMASRTVSRVGIRPGKEVLAVTVPVVVTVRDGEVLSVEEVDLRNGFGVGAR